jgi:dTMP kinase
VHDPGGTAVGDKIRQILLDRGSGRITAMCEVMLFMASRVQLVAERIKPALEAGKVVLCDRFVSATVAYQGASGISAKTIIEIGDAAVEGHWPDLTIVLDVPAEVGLRRAGQRQDRAGAKTDRMETRQLSYHRAVRRNFEQLRECYPRPVAHVRADRDEKAVFRDVLAELEKAFPGQA